MISPLNLPNEEERLKVIDSLEFLNQRADQQLQEIAELTARFCEVPIVLLSVVRENDQVFHVSYGLDTPSTSREVSFCGHAIHGDDLFLIQDAHSDIRFADNPLVTGDPNIRFYAGYPLEVSGQKIGTFCLIDRNARSLTPLQEEFHRVMSRQVENLINQKASGEYYLQLIDRYAAGLEEMEDSFSKMREVLSAISHDAIAPVRTIRTLFQMSKEDDSVRIEDFVQDIHQSLEASESLLKNLIQWGLELVNQPVNTNSQVPIHQLMGELQEELGQDMKRKNNSLSWQGPDLAISTEPNKLRFILRNLLRNSNKFSRNSQILLSWELINGELNLQVTDQGTGMDEEQLQRIRLLHGTDSKSGTDGESGFGLGLALVHRFARNIGARLDFESEKGVGTVCNISFPLN